MRLPCSTDGEQVALVFNRHQDRLPFVTITIDDDVTPGRLSVHVSRADVRKLRDQLGAYLEATET